MHKQWSNEMLTQYKEVAMIHDVRKSYEVVKEIAWCGNPSKNLTKGALKDSIHVSSVVISEKESAQNLIKALEMAIELGWVK